MGISEQGLINKKTGRYAPICGIYAVSLITNKNLSIIFNHYKTENELSGKWKGRTQFSKLLPMMEEYGINLKPMEVIPQRLINFIKSITHIDKPLLIRTNGHIQIVYGNYVIDQSGTHHIKDFWGKNKIVVNALIVDESLVI